MKLNRFITFCSAILFLILGSSLQAEDWTTTDGKVYKEVSVVKAEPDAVMILHQDGGALVPLLKLPAELQKRFNYDPAKCKAAADARTQAEAEYAALIMQAQSMANAALAAQCTSDESCGNTSSGVSGSHYSMDSLVNTGSLSSSFGPDHHSMDGLVRSGLFDSYGPTHHSMSSLLGH